MYSLNKNDLFSKKITHIFLNIYTVINILFIDRIKLMNIHKNIYDN